ncbi:hypothetical protein B0T19DRAFT_255520 [Cercophora scortea]|uniref:Uncharacterized protein n=1 Tax=Cercophora scortea TaxID=314031 RepID=A0AAE0M6A0_9PEZI|nr:hypothetical protein B0T19DRAFT_255520 [Cercophora scortea]
MLSFPSYKPLSPRRSLRILSSIIPTSSNLELALPQGKAVTILRRAVTSKSFVADAHPCCLAYCYNSGIGAVTTMAYYHQGSSSSESEDEALGGELPGEGLAPLSPPITEELPNDYQDEHGSSGDSSPEEGPEPVTMTARAYQIEMLEESLKQNIIVAMDTGSGKTQV